MAVFYSTSWSSIIEKNEKMLLGFPQCIDLFLYDTVGNLLNNLVAVIDY